MENTLENKAKFFALYWGQEIMKEFKEDLNETVYMSNPHANQSKISSYYLELTPLSQISDEDAKNFLEIIGLKYKIEEDDFYKMLLKENKLYEYFASVRPIVLEEWNYLVDFLRSKGYALPFMGISVETLVEWGWIKLKNS
jgi:hypothetical protein